MYDEAIASTPAKGDATKPVGLGAFKFESYTPGNGNAFVAVRNDDYWRGPNGITGEDLPYLDKVEIVVAVDIDSRSSSLRSGQFNIIHTSNADEIAAFLEDDGFESHVSDTFGETNYLMLNVAEGATTGKPPRAPTPTARCCTCRAARRWPTPSTTTATTRSAPPACRTVANGPFPEGSIGWLEDTGYPKFDLDAARPSSTSACGVGTDHIKLSFNTTNDPFNVESNKLILAMWQDAFGDKIDATITPIEQGQYIGLGLTGTFEILGWRSHSGSDPDQQRRWWSTTAAADRHAGANFGRFVDPVIDEALDIIRTNGDPAARKAAAEAINRRFGEQVYNLWLSWALWGVITQPQVNGVEVNDLPGGGKGPGVAFGGRHQIDQIWCDDGNCE